jgi:hypothetical protein
LGGFVVKSNGIDIDISSLSALDVFMEPGKSARVRCAVCHTMQQVKRGLMVLHDDANAEDCAGSFTHYTFNWTYDEWAADLGFDMEQLHKRFSGAHAIDPRVRHATRVSPVRYPGKPGPLHRRPQHPSQTTGHSPERLAALDGAKYASPSYPKPDHSVTAGRRS